MCAIVLILTYMKPSQNFRNIKKTCGTNVYHWAKYWRRLVTTGNTNHKIGKRFALASYAESQVKRTEGINKEGKEETAKWKVT